jgi:hypothetical protein
MKIQPTNQRFKILRNFTKLVAPEGAMGVSESNREMTIS